MPTSPSKGISGSREPEALFLARFLPQCAQHRGAADGKAENRSQRRYQREVGAEVENVGQERGDREDQPQCVEPKRGPDAIAHILAKAQLQEQSGETDSRHHYHGERAGESGSAGVDHDQREREQKQSGGNDAPAAGLRRWLGLRDGGRVGSGVGQGIPSQVIQGGLRSLQMRG